MSRLRNSAASMSGIRPWLSASVTTLRRLADSPSKLLAPAFWKAARREAGTSPVNISTTSAQAAIRRARSSAAATISACDQAVLAATEVSIRNQELPSAIRVAQVARLMSRARVTAASRRGMTASTALSVAAKALRRLRETGSRGRANPASRRSFGRARAVSIWGNRATKAAFARRSGSSVTCTDGTSRSRISVQNSFSASARACRAAR